MIDKERIKQFIEIFSLLRQRDQALLEKDTAQKELATCCEDRDAAVLERDALRAQRDGSIKEASRRDQKWMDGINEIVGRKLDYGDPCSDNCASTALGAIVKEREEARVALQQAQADAAAMREALDEVWESCEMGWITDGDPDSSYCECGECGAKQLNSKEGVIHCEDCLQGKVHKARATDSGKAILAALEKCEKALEYCGCHEHNESPCDESGSHHKSSCTFCNTIDEALAAIHAVKGEKL